MKFVLWTAADVDNLRNGIMAGLSRAEIGLTVGRREKAVSHKIYALGWDGKHARARIAAERRLAESQGNKPGQCTAKDIIAVYERTRSIQATAQQCRARYKDVVAVAGAAGLLRVALA